MTCVRTSFLVVLLGRGLLGGALEGQSGASGVVRLGESVPIPRSNPAPTSAYVATVGRRGDLFVTGPDSAAIFWYSKGGLLQGVFGREGKGPGEFTRIRALGWIGDSLWARDDGQSRYTLFSSEGTLIRTLAPQRLAPRSRSSVFLVYALLPGNRRLHLEGFEQTAEAAVTAGGARVVVSKGGESSDTILTLGLSSAPALRLHSSKGATLTVPQPWGGADLLAIAPDGLRLIQVRRTPVRDGKSWTYQILAHDINGQEIFRRSIPFEPQYITDAVMSEWMERFANPQISAGFTADEIRKQLRDKVYRPAVVPPTVRIIIGTDGTTWISREVNGGKSVCDIVDVSGRYLGTVSLPAKRRLLAATRDVLWAVHENTGHDESEIQLERIPVIRR
jgi:hypothetical protein